MRYVIERNDISAMNADAIVLPANVDLKEGSGTSTALYEKAGRRELELACKEAKRRYKGQLYEGEAIPTLAFGLDADFIIHAIVPTWKDGNSQEYERLSSAYISSLRLADMMGCKSIAFPLLASGNNGFDYRLAFNIAIESIEAFTSARVLEKVTLVIYGMHITEYVRELGLPIAEVIDQKYVLAKNEQYQSPIEKTLIKYLNRGVTIGIKAGEQVVDAVFQKAETYFENPENIDKLLGEGVKIARNVKKKMLDIRTSD